MVTSGDVRRAKQKAVGGKKDRCRKGKSCSATCISGWKACLVEMTTSVSDSLRKTSRVIGRKADKVLPVVRDKFLGRKREDYVRIRKELLSQIERAYLKKDPKRAAALERKLEALQERLGGKLRVPGIEPRLSEEKMAGIKKRRQKFNKVMVNVLNDMEEAAASGRRGTYDKLEAKMLKLQEIGGKKFGYTYGKFEKGEIWGDNSGARNKSRRESLKKAHDELYRRLQVAARAKDRDQYLKIEKALLKVQSRAGSKFDPSLFSKITKGQVWAKESVDVARLKERLMNDVIRAVASDNRGRYDKAIERAERVANKLGIGDISALTTKNTWDNYQGLAHFLTRLDKSGIKNGREGTTGITINHRATGGWQEVNIESMVRGNKLSVIINPDGYSFKVNDSYLISPNMPRVEQVAIIREVRRQFEEVTRNMGEGTTLTVSAARGDRGEERRESGYRGFGFSDPDRSGQMYGKVVNGVLVPIDKDEFEEGVSYRFSKV